MNHVIYKYPIDVEQIVASHVEIEMPAGAEILSAAFQGDQMCVWAHHKDPSKAPKSNVTIAIHGTGTGALDSYLGEFIDTVFYHGLVFHIFEVTTPQQGSTDVET